MCLENFTDHVWVGHVQKIWSGFDNRINSFFFFQNCETSDGINLGHINNGMATIPIGFKQNCSFCLFTTRWRFRLLLVSHQETYGRFDWSVKLTNELWETDLSKNKIFILFFYDFSKFGIDKGVKFKLICGWINFTFWQFNFFGISKLKNIFDTAYSNIFRVSSLKTTEEERPVWLVHFWKDRPALSRQNLTFSWAFQYETFLQKLLVLVSNNLCRIHMKVKVALRWKIVLVEFQRNNCYPIEIRGDA